MKILKEKLKISMTILLIILLFIIVGIFIYVNKEIIVNGITSWNKILKQEENNLESTNSTSNSSIDKSKWDTNKVNIVYDKDNIPVPVPKGYIASSVENGVTPIGQIIEEENRVSTGFVIYEMTAEEIKNGTEVSITKENFWEESQKRNQWVWVPVPDTSRIYERDGNTGKIKSKMYNFSATGRTLRNNNSEPGTILRNYDNEKTFAMHGMQGYTKEQLSEELENEFENTVESIEKYGGFYIGRYETGNISLEIPVVQRMQKDISSQTWYSMYTNMKKISNNPNIKTNMILGCLWDETLQWFIDTGTKNNEEVAKNSTEWGNYRTSTYEYIQENGTIRIKQKYEEKQVPTGSSEHNKANNIYDMAGNVMDYTTEVSGTQRYCRGNPWNGSASGDEQSSARGWRGYYDSTTKNSYIGGRAFMYIK